MVFSTAAAAFQCQPPPIIRSIVSQVSIGPRVGVSALPVSLKPLKRRHAFVRLQLSNSDNNNNNNNNSLDDAAMLDGLSALRDSTDDNGKIDDVLLAFVDNDNDLVAVADSDSEEEENAHGFLQSLDDILEELEDYDVMGDIMEQDDLDFEEVMWDEDSLNDIFGGLSEEEESDDGQTEQDAAEQERIQEQSSAITASLENALLQGVVPVSAGVGSEAMPGDFGFDPLNLANKDYFPKAQAFLIRMLPGGPTADDDKSETDTLQDSSQPSVSSVSTTTTLPVRRRPRALILRDYREAEIRHGRLAMIAAVFWPLQEMLDRLLLDDDQFGPLLYGPITLPYFPLLMTAIMLLLGYLDIYSQAIKDIDKIGEAFLPGDCFWDPLQMLQGAPASMKRNMQERELFNGRVAMLAVALYIWEEAITHVPLISIEGNQLLFLPAYQVPFIQAWLDARFSEHDALSAFSTPADPALLKAILDQVVDSSSSLN